MFNYMYFELFYKQFCLVHVNIDSESDDDDDDSENSVLKRAGSLLTGKSDNLPRGFLDIARVKDANIDKPSNVSDKRDIVLYILEHCSDG